jgi:hypothetical protein
MMSNQLYGYQMEILALEPGEANGQPVAMLTVRHEPELASAALLLFGREQCVRIRDSLDRFLNDAESWLYIPVEQQLAMHLEE